MDNEVILTPYEVDCLERLEEITKAKLEYEKLVLKNYRDSRKIQSGEENVNPDSAYVQDVYDAAMRLEYYQLLLSDYEFPEMKDDTVSVGSYVTVYLQGKQDFSFLIVQKTRIPANQTPGVKLVSMDAPIADAIIGKHSNNVFSYKKPNGEDESGVIVGIDNNFGKLHNRQKTVQ